MSDSMLPLAPDRHTGRRLGKYEVLCRLSSGGMSQIFLAFQRGHAGFRKLVVLKQILPDIQGEEDIVRMFLDEAKITASFNHPNIAHVYDLDVADGELFLAMEFITGATLIEVARACRLADEPIPLGFTLAAVRDTALALHYAHTFKDPLGRPRQVIHRDVAEKNIMVTYEGTTKLLDFGIAKAADRESQTAAGKVKGTSGYMSPEQIRGDELDPRTDVFSLGIVLHECLTGLRLFYGKDAEEGMKVALESTPLPPSRNNPEVGPELDAVVMRALAHERQERFSTALEFARALERVAAGRIWLPEQCGELMQRYFAERREQTIKLLEGSSLHDISGEFPQPRRKTEPALPEADAELRRLLGSDSSAPALASAPRLPPPPKVLAFPASSRSSAREGAGAEESTVIEPRPRRRRPESRAVDPDEERTQATPMARGTRAPPPNRSSSTDPTLPPQAEADETERRPRHPAPGRPSLRPRLAIALGLGVGLLAGFILLLKLLHRL